MSNGRILGGPVTNEPKPKPDLPAWRTWTVRQVDDFGLTQEHLIAAHELNIVGDVVCFLVYSLANIEGDDVVLQKYTRVFKDYRDIEEVMQVTGRQDN